MREAITQRIKIATIVLLCGGSSAAWAQDASAWEGELHAATRLIAGESIKSSDAKWARRVSKSGWIPAGRLIGDIRVIWACRRRSISPAPRTSNRCTAFWPAPERFDDGAGGHSIGYVGDVVLPLRIVRRGPEQTIGAARHARLRGLRQSLRSSASQLRPYVVRQGRRRRADARRGGSARTAARPAWGRRRSHWRQFCRRRARYRRRSPRRNRRRS